MLFHSYEFIYLFLPITLAVFFLLSKQWGKSAGMTWLTLASLFFYGYWDAAYIPLLLLSIVVNFCLGKRIAKDGKPALLAGIIFNLALLGYFKYTYFFLGTITNLKAEALPLPGIVLPLGISFFTFTQIAFLVDIYKGKTKADNFASFLEFVAFFPNLIAGPIISYRETRQQFEDEKNYRINWENVARGMMLFAFGFFKKICIADAISPWVGNLFAHVASLSCFEAWLAAVGYTLQLYFDFSGYTEMAIGIALMFNLRFPMNFDSPCRALSIIDYWRRWHITLGMWLREYIYIPLGGNRHGEWKKMRNLCISMLIIGLWHGAGWTFVFWGALHGIFLVINNQWRHLGIKLPAPLSWLITFCAVVCAYVFFREDSFDVAMAVLAAMAGLGNGILPASGLLLGSSIVNHAFFTLFCLALVLLVKNPVRIVSTAKPSLASMAVMLLLIFAALLGNLAQDTSDFLYCQF